MIDRNESQMPNNSDGFFDGLPVAPVKKPRRQKPLKTLISKRVKPEDSEPRVVKSPKKQAIHKPAKSPVATGKSSLRKSFNNLGFVEKDNAGVEGMAIN